MIAFASITGGNSFLGKQMLFRNKQIMADGNIICNTGKLLIIKIRLTSYIE